MSLSTTEMTSPEILICDDDADFHAAVKYALKTKFKIQSAYNADEALILMKKQHFSAILLDIQMRTNDEGLKYLPLIREQDPAIAIIITSGLTDFQTVKQAMLLGANDYVPKDFETDDLSHTIRISLEKADLKRRCEQQNFEAASHQRKHVLVGESASIVQLRKSLERLRKSPANVLITGETGTGKEVIARLLRGTLADGTLAPFVAIDSATIQSTMAESILFGHEKGAFTGADRSAKGIFEEADGGIVYFDEIGNMPLDIQAKLLRVLQEREVCRLGSSKVLPLDFRVVAATNKDLDEEVKKGLFKADLLQRIQVLPLSLPSLRERKEDIPLLVQHYIRTHYPNHSTTEFTTECMECLQRYDWPGNIRELNNILAYVMTMSEDNTIDLMDLPPKIRNFIPKPHTGSAMENIGSSANGGDGAPFYDQVSTFEKNVLQQAYQSHQGNISKLSKVLQMDRSHLYSKLKEYAIHTVRQT